ncbi:MAG: outer membrane beta-barrel protein, partial [Woeseiaceae bacterium]
AADGYTRAGVGTLPLGEKFSLSGRCGFFYHDAEATTGGVIEREPSESDPFVGLGVGFDLSEVFQINAGVDYIDTDDAEPLLATVGFTLRF